MLKLLVVYQLLSLTELGTLALLVLFFDGEFSEAVRSTVFVSIGTSFPVSVVFPASSFTKR
jgi:hypothetical protein